jgi:hypothetical protein
MLRAALIPVSIAALVAGAGAQVPQPRTVLVIVDELHLNFRDTPRIRRLTGELMRPLIASGDLCGIVSTGTSDVSVTPTSDAAPLETAITRLVGSGLGADFILPARQQTDPGVERRERVTQAVSTAIDAVNALAARQGGRPFDVVYFSNGYDTRLSPVPMELTTAATRAGAAIHTIDLRGFSDAAAPQGLSAAEWNAYLKASRDSLAAMASGTMGLHVSTAGDFQTLLTRLGAGGR